VNQHIKQGLKIVQTPYLPPLKDTSKRMTLVLDLDETLLHFEELNQDEGQLAIRPYAEEFLLEMSQIFELVIFTAGTEDYANCAIGYLENQDLIAHRLFRHHTIPFRGFYVKDLSRIGRDLDQTIIVDNLAQNFQLQPENGIHIQTWISDPMDKCLAILGGVLKRIALEPGTLKENLKRYQEAN
jgi:CTD small phosphatase-like protein 2